MKALPYALAFLMTSFGTVANAQDTTAVRVHIAAASVADAVNQWAQQTGFRVVWTEDASTSTIVPELDGVFTPRQSLERLLKNTHLRVEFPDNHTAFISSVQSRAVAKGAPLHLANTTSEFPLAESGSDSTSLEQVLVTAQKQGEQRIQDVPIPITVLSADNLVETNQFLVRDYIDSVPGLSLEPGIQNHQTLSIRGIAGYYGNPSVGVTVDDVPFGGSTLDAGNVVPDIDPGDLARIEVLRGPQGTLYGANSMGGLIKYVTIDPSTAGYSGRVEGGTSGVYNGAEPGFDFRASANVPVTDTFALRMSAFERQDPGYIDNPTLNVKGINEDQAYGGHIAAMWRPSVDFSLKLSALYQDIRGDAPSEVNRGPGLGNWQQNYIAGAGKYDKAIQAYSANIKAKLGDVDVTSVTGYNIVHAADALEFAFLSSNAQQLFGVTGSLAHTSQPDYKFTQEIRLSASLWKWFDWMIGGFYTHENAPYVQNTTASDSVTGQDVGQFYNLSTPSTYREYAGFGNLTFHLTDRIDIQIGGRESQIRQGRSEVWAGPNYPYLPGPSPYIIPHKDISSNAFTYSAMPSFKVSQDILVYARVASGYRPGGFNNVSPNLPQQYYPDKAKDYEVGIKGDLLERVVSIDASIYHVDWTSIQLLLYDPQTVNGYNANAGRAKSEGVELAVQLRPITGLIVATWADYDNAVVTQTFPSASPFDPAGAPGDRLPYSSRLSGHISVDESFPLWSDVKAFAGGSLSYVGNREGNFGTVGSPKRQSFPGYGKMDLRAGVRDDSWTVNLFVNNLANRRALLTGGLDYFPSTAFVYIQPRTVGVDVVKRF